MQIGTHVVEGPSQDAVFYFPHQPILSLPVNALYYPHGKPCCPRNLLEEEWVLGMQMQIHQWSQEKEYG